MRNIAVVLLVVVMAIVTEVTGQQEIIFPEVGALCVGLLLMEKAVWNVRAWQVPVLLTAAALIGLFINICIPVSFEIRFVLAFILVVLMLRLRNCNMFPTVSAAMLPVLIETTSWIYPIAVLVLSSLMVMVRHWLPQTDRPEYHPASFLHWTGLAAALGVILATIALIKPLLSESWGSVLHFCMVPPLVVTMIEFANRNSGFRQRPWTIWGLIVAAAVVGTLSEWFIHRTLGVPMAIGAALSTTIMLLLFRRFKPFAPALAITLVPMLLPDAAIPYFPVLATIGSAYFIIVGMLCFSQEGSRKYN
ncbi:MAG: hypothetical protein K6A41_04760 [Bacteroidales bacterium]|nr:hypothetical protein [Bacteroidales bacterium]